MIAPAMQRVPPAQLAGLTLRITNRKTIHLMNITMVIWTFAIRRRIISLVLPGACGSDAFQVMIATTSRTLLSTSAQRVHASTRNVR